MIEGCVAWQCDGLNPPPAVRDATKEYMEAEDAIATWPNDCCVVDPDAKESSTALFQSWAAWANAAKEPVGSQRALSQKLGARFRPHREAGGRGFLGLRVSEAGETEW
jgi:putative DNA primase/helicase